MEIVKYDKKRNLATFLDESTEVLEDLDLEGFQEVLEDLFVNSKYINATFGSGVLIGTGEMLAGNATIEGGIEISHSRVINPELIVVVLKDKVEMLNSTIHNLTEEDVKKLKK